MPPIISLKEVGAFFVGYCISECVEKDYAIKPVICGIVCAIGTAYGAKLTYDCASVTYDVSVKPVLKAILKRRTIGGGNLPPLP